MKLDKEKIKQLACLPRRWFPLWLIDWYIFREFFVKYCILMLVFIVIFILQNVYQDVSDFIDFKAGANFREVIAYYAYKLPLNLQFVLPISMLLGCIWTMITFAKNREITALRACGVSLIRCGFPILLFGVFTSLVSVVLGDLVVPHCEKEAIQLYEKNSDNKKNTTAMLAYRSGDKKRHWLFETFLIGDTQRKVMLKTFWSANLIKQVFNAPGTPEYREKINLVFGSRADMLLKSPDIEAQIMSVLLDRPIDITAETVSYNSKTQEWTFNNGIFASYEKSSDTGRGISIMHKDINYKQLRFSHVEMPESPDDIMNAVKDKESLSVVVIWDVLKKTPNMPEKIRAIYLTVFYYRLAFPWACFLAVFLGIPLATKNERSGSVLAILSSIAIIVVYIVVAQIFLMLGKGGYINPIVAGLAPTLVFIVYGAWSVVRDRT